MTSYPPYSQIAKILATMGVKGDSHLVHVNDREIALLKKHGGSGGINPHTGLQQFFDMGVDGSNQGGGAGDSGTQGSGGGADGGSGSDSTASAPDTSAASPDAAVASAAPAAAAAAPATAAPDPSVLSQIGAFVSAMQDPFSLSSAFSSAKAGNYGQAAIQGLGSLGLGLLGGPVTAGIGIAGGLANALGATHGNDPTGVNATGAAGDNTGLPAAAPVAATPAAVAAAAPVAAAPSATAAPVATAANTGFFSGFPDWFIPAATGLF